MLALLSLPALAGEITVAVMNPVVIAVDGQIPDAPQGSNLVVASGLSGGSHLVEAMTITGISVEVGLGAVGAGSAASGPAAMSGADFAALRAAVVDPRNAYRIDAHLDFSSDKEKVQALFR